MRLCITVLSENTTKVPRWILCLCD
jgi:hypothetical protein